MAITVAALEGRPAPSFDSPAKGVITGEPTNFPDVRAANLTIAMRHQSGE